MDDNLLENNFSNPPQRKKINWFFLPILPLLIVVLTVYSISPYALYSHYLIKETVNFVLFIFVGFIFSLFPSNFFVFTGGFVPLIKATNIYIVFSISLLWTTLISGILLFFLSKIGWHRGRRFFCALFCILIATGFIGGFVNEKYCVYKTRPTIVEKTGLIKFERYKMQAPFNLHEQYTHNEDEYLFKMGFFRRNGLKMIASRTWQDEVRYITEVGAEHEATAICRLKKSFSFGSLIDLEYIKPVTENELLSDMDFRVVWSYVDPSFCEGNSISNDDCYESLAKGKSSIGLCYKISNLGRRENCKNNLNFAQVVNNCDNPLAVSDKISCENLAGWRVAPAKTPYANITDYTVLDRIQFHYPLYKKNTDDNDKWVLSEWLINDEFEQRIAKGTILNNNRTYEGEPQKQTVDSIYDLGVGNANIFSTGEKYEKIQLGENIWVKMADKKNDLVTYRTANDKYLLSIETTIEGDRSQILQKIVTSVEFNSITDK